MGATIQTYAELVELGYVSTTPMMVELPASVPTLFSDPVTVSYTAIDYRLQMSADLMGSRDLGASGRKGRLSNPSGRRLREHFYRFPDQCDAPPIALEVFLRMELYDQVEAFFRPAPRIGLWHDLFPEVSRREYDYDNLSVARWYVSRYAEGYVHSLTNGGYVYPLETQSINTQMMAIGLDPFDDNMDPTTSVGLGNLIGKRATEWLEANDQLGKANDWIDTVGLERIEARHGMTSSWNQWQPSYAGSGRFQGIRPGVVTKQTFVAPSLGVFSYLYMNESDFINLGLQAAVPSLDMSESAYLTRSRMFMEAQKDLTDRQKAVAELANNKITSSVFLIVSWVPLLKLHASTEEYQALYDDFSIVTSGCAEYAGIHAAWRHKRTYYAGRPQTIVRSLFKRKVADFAVDYPEAEMYTSMIPAVRLSSCSNPISAFGIQPSHSPSRIHVHPHTGRPSRVPEWRHRRLRGVRKGGRQLVGYTSNPPVV